MWQLWKATDAGATRPRSAVSRALPGYAGRSAPLRVLPPCCPQDGARSDRFRRYFASNGDPILVHHDGEHEYVYFKDFATRVFVAVVTASYPVDLLHSARGTGLFHGVGVYVCVRVCTCACACVCISVCLSVCVP